MLIGGTIACIFVSLVLFMFSYLIWRKKELGYIAGYNETKFKGDKEKLAKAAGIFLFSTGILTIILPFALEIYGPMGGKMIMAVIAVKLIGLIVYVNTINKK